MNIMKVFSQSHSKNTEHQQASVGKATSGKENNNNSQEHSRSTFLSRIADNLKDNILDLR